MVSQFQWFCFIDHTASNLHQVSRNGVNFLFCNLKKFQPIFTKLLACKRMHNFPTYLLLTIHFTLLLLGVAEITSVPSRYSHRTCQSNFQAKVATQKVFISCWCGKLCTCSEARSFGPYRFKFS